tara:strand:+ start:862 stop:1035 length:174 start_codon:yes stop_codon:yes gene_type:complete
MKHPIAIILPLFDLFADRGQMKFSGQPAIVARVGKSFSYQKGSSSLFSVYPEFAILE